MCPPRRNTHNADLAEKIVENKYPQLKEIGIRFGLVQRLDYLLHIPISKMTRGNVFYGKVKEHLRKNLRKIIKNNYLSQKEKVYLLLLAIAPKLIRALHRKIKSIFA